MKKTKNNNKSNSINLRASQAALWNKCPGSLFIKVPKFSDTSAADEGTFIHALCEIESLKKYETEPKIKPELKAHLSLYEALDDNEKWEIDVIKDFYLKKLDFYISSLSNYYLLHNESAINSEIYFEFPVKYSRGKVNLSGTADCVLIDHAEKLIYVIDLKTGYSFVDARMNSQLLIYAHAVADNLNLKGYNFKLIIIQPRTRDVSAWTGRISDSYLSSICEIVEERYSVPIAKRVTKLESGTHCRYCPARFNCSVLQESIKLITSPETLGKAQTGPELWDLILTYEKTLTTMFKDTKSAMIDYFELGGNSKLNKKEKSKKVDEIKKKYKPVTRNIRRTWISGIEPGRLAKDLKLPVSKITDSSLKSPAYFDKLKLKPNQRERVESCTSMITSTSFEIVDKKASKKEKEFSF